MGLIHEAGFQGEAANIMYAIVMAESGGRAHAHNGNASTGDNSYGLAQINMLGDMGPQRLREFGLKSANDLYDPLTNLRVAYQMSQGGTKWTDWSTYNRGDYLQYLGQSGAKVSLSGSTSGGGGGMGSMNTAGSPRDTLSRTDSLGSLFNQVPELRKLIDQAVAGNWTQATFQNEVETSNWWKTHSDSARAAIIQKANDPAAYNERFSHAAHSVVDLAHQLGFAITGPQAQAIANTAILTGNETNQAWLTQQLSSHENYTGTTTTAGLQGQMAGTAQQIQGMLGDYGQKWSPAQIAEAAQAVVSGRTTLDTYKQQIQNWAVSAYPSLAKQIQGGQTVRELATPYVSSMSNLLEIDPNSITMFDPRIRKALQGVTDSSGNRVQVPLWQFEDQVRQDPRWQYTQNARDTMATALTKLGSDFGFGPQG